MLKFQHTLCDPVVVSGGEGLNCFTSCPSQGAAFAAESVGKQHVSFGKLGYWVPCYPRLPRMFPCLHLLCCWPPFTFSSASLPGPCGMCSAVPRTGHIPRAVCGRPVNTCEAMDEHSVHLHTISNFSAQAAAAVFPG